MNHSIKLNADTIFAGCWHLDHKQDFVWAKRGFKSPEDHADFICKDIADYYRDHPYAKLVFLGDGFLNSTPERARAYFARMGIPMYYLFGNHEGPTYQIYRAELELVGFQIGEIYPLDIANVTFLGLQASFSIERQMIVAQHFPLSIWDKSHHGAWMAHSHCHGSFAESLPSFSGCKRLDVGVDVCLKEFGRSYITFAQLKAIMDKKTAHVVDHHNPNTG